MNTASEFRFVTRTVSEDYRVYAGGGGDILSDLSDFDPLRKKGRIIPEEGPCAVIWEESELIFLTVSGMSRGVNDRANRPIRFSFCEIFRDRAKAWAAFTRVISDFGEAESEMRSLIRETPGTGDIEFGEEKFMSWLQGQRRGGLTFRPCREGDIIARNGDSWPCVWPPEGLLLKWRTAEDDEISCERIGGQPRKAVRVPEKREPRKNSGWIKALFGGIIA